MNPGEGAAVGHLVVEGQHAVWWKRAWVRRRIDVWVHGAIMVHCWAEQVGAAWQGAGFLSVEGLWMTSRITGVRQVPVTVCPQPLHDARRPNGLADLQAE